MSLYEWFTLLLGFLSWIVQVIELLQKKNWRPLERFGRSGSDPVVLRDSALRRETSSHKEDKSDPVFEECPFYADRSQRIAPLRSTRAIHSEDTTERGDSGMGVTSTSVEVFCSYAHEDEVWRQKLETHLSLLRRQGLITLWHDRLIVSGTDWVHAIDLHLETASIILLLVSAHFFASDYCYGIEMQHALKRHEAGEAHVIPLLVRPVDWKNAPFAHLQILPTNARPLSTWQDEDIALTDIVAGIRHMLEDLPRLSTGVPSVPL